MIDALAPIASFPIRGTVAPFMRLATFATPLAIITAATGPSFRQSVSRQQWIIVGRRTVLLPRGKLDGLCTQECYAHEPLPFQ